MLKSYRDGAVPHEQSLNAANSWPYSWHMSINRIWKQSAITLYGERWHTQLTEDYCVWSTWEINITVQTCCDQVRNTSMLTSCARKIVYQFMQLKKQTHTRKVKARKVTQTKKQKFQEKICRLQTLQRRRCVHSAWPAPVCTSIQTQTILAVNNTAHCCSQKTFINSTGSPILLNTSIGARTNPSVLSIGLQMS